MDKERFFHLFFTDVDFFAHFVKDHLIQDGVDLSLSVTDRCTTGCLHCLTNACLAGKSMPLEVFRKLDFRYFQRGRIGLFCVGDPLDYRYKNADLRDLIILLRELGISVFDFLTSGVSPKTKKRLALLKRLEQLQTRGISINPDLSFHLYWPVSDDKILQTAKERLMMSVDILSSFTSDITVQLRGDLDSVNRNIGQTLNIYLQTLEEMGFTEAPCEHCLNPCGNTTICRVKDSIILRASLQMTQQLGRWDRILSEELVATFSPAQQEMFQSAWKISPVDVEKMLKQGICRNIDANRPSLFVFTNGDLDVAYSVPVLAQPCKIANIFENSYDEVIDLWISHLWEHFYRSHQDSVQDFVNGKPAILFEQ